MSYCLHCFSNQVGIGSIEQDAPGDDMIFSMADCDFCWNTEKDVKASTCSAMDGISGELSSCMSRLLWMQPIFWTKYSLNDTTSSLGGES